MATKVKSKIKKRRPKAAKSKKRQDAGEHQDPLIASVPIIVVPPASGKVLKPKLRWWTVIDEHLYYYYIGEHSNDEIRELSGCLYPTSRFQSHRSFTAARKYLYSQAIMEMEKFAAVVKKIRTRKKAEYHVDR